MHTFTTCAALLSTSFLVSLPPSPASADLRLPAIFGDGMVIQRDQPFEVWGWADPGSRIHVLLGTESSLQPRTYATTCRADASGRWTATVVEPGQGPEWTDASWTLRVSEYAGDRPMPELIVDHDGRRIDLEESGGEDTSIDRVMISDILVGEVWICGGQSNMEWPINQSDGDGRSKQEMTNARIRLINVPRRASARPQEDIDAGWERCTPERIGSWTAVGYFFADRLNRELQVPIGLISSNWGGTRIEPWIDLEDLREHPTFRDRANTLAERIHHWEALDAERLQEMQEGARKTLERDQATYWKRINSEDPGHRGGWMKSNLDEREWREMELPGEWERSVEELRDFDGTVWFRKEITIPPEWRDREDVVLNLGGVDDSDQTYFNGTLIGCSTDWVNRNRRYPVPNELLTEEAVVTVCALDPHGAGGLTGPRITLDAPGIGESIDLQGTWKWRTGIRTNRTVQSSASMPSNPGEQATAYGSLNNGMIKPLVPYSVRGAIWYQGESNAAQASEYRILLPMLIDSWRSDFGDDLAFGIVQLAAFKEVSQDPDQGGWAHLRDAQRHAARTVPNTGLVVTTDVGDARDIHPRNKKAVGDRLAGWALHDVYNDETAVPSGPIALDARRSGPSVVVNFTECADSLAVAGGLENLDGFALAGSDGRFFWANATIDGKNQVVVRSNQVREPRIVSYGWQDNPVRANLVNSEMLPACPFRLEITEPGTD
ncbi:MAG: sialate O-acetylesterase [Planctomycetota bacterium]|nr:sialate O-acetylesterase [Planctomycetota bacterium]